MKYVRIIAALLCLLLLVSCATEPTSDDSSINESVIFESSEAESDNSLSEESAVFDKTPREIEFIEHVFPASLKYGDEYSQYSILRKEDGRFGTIVIDSRDDIAAFTEMLEYSNQTPEFFESLPEDFFEEKLLLLNDITAPMTGYNIAVRSVRADEDGVTVEYIYTHAEEGGMTVVPGICAVEIDRADVAGCESFAAESEFVHFDTTERELDFTSHTFVGKFGLDYLYVSPTSVRTTLIMNTGSLSQLVKVSESNEFNEFAKDKDKKYFQTKALIIACIPSSSSGNIFELLGISCGEHGTALKIQRRLDGTTNDVQHLIIVAEVDKHEVFGSHSGFAAVSDTEQWQRAQKAPLYFDGTKTEVMCEMDIIARETKLPLVATLKAIGAEIEWSSDTRAAIKYNGRSYSLNLKTKKLVRGNEDRLWGEVEERTALTRELLVDYHDFWGFMLHESECNTSVNYDGNYAEVNIRDKYYDE
ncbi:MAG: hypothetical protein J6R49_03490 [Clostridia bacterium]|nr:hypothetical protein [Clostridia bacterium]